MDIKNRPLFLIVEDEAVMGMFYKAVLKRENIEVHIVNEGNKALESLHTIQPDMAILDIKLPGAISGIDIANEITAKHSIPFAFITGDADHTTREKALETKPLDFLLKPVNSNQISELVKKFHEQTKKD